MFSVSYIFRHSASFLKFVYAGNVSDSAGNDYLKMIEIKRRMI